MSQVTKIYGVVLRRFFNYSIQLIHQHLFEWRMNLLFPKLVLTELILQILYWIYEFAIHSHVFMLDLPTGNWVLYSLFHCLWNCGNAWKFLKVCVVQRSEKCRKTLELLLDNIESALNIIFKNSGKPLQRRQRWRMHVGTIQTPWFHLRGHVFSEPLWTCKNSYFWQKTVFLKLQRWIYTWFSKPYAFFIQNFYSVVPNTKKFHNFWMRLIFWNLFRSLESIFWPFWDFFNEVVRHKLECPDCGDSTCRTNDTNIRTL
jgi:hypothetical protein